MPGLHRAPIQRQHHLERGQRHAGGLGAGQQVEETEDVEETDQRDTEANRRQGELDPVPGPPPEPVQLDFALGRVGEFGRKADDVDQRQI